MDISAERGESRISERANDERRAGFVTAGNGASDNILSACARGLFHNPHVHQHPLQKCSVEMSGEESFAVFSTPVVGCLHSHHSGSDVQSYSLSSVRIGEFFEPPAHGEALRIVSRPCGLQSRMVRTKKRVFIRYGSETFGQEVVTAADQRNSGDGGIECRF